MRGSLFSESLKFNDLNNKHSYTHKLNHKFSLCVLMLLLGVLCGKN